MAEKYLTHLAWRGAVSVSGPDSRSLLQGLLTQDVALADGRHACWGGFLTPQGRFLHDLFILQAPGLDSDALLLEVERERTDDLVQRLSRYRLRARCQITGLPDAWQVLALWGEESATTLPLASEPGALVEAHGGLVWRDPRHPVMGLRALVPTGATDSLTAAGFVTAPAAAWDAHRIALGVPDGSRDLEAERSLPMESGFDGLNGISWTKGCYVGQELTARMHYRALVKRRLIPVRIDGPLPRTGATIRAGEAEIGDMRSVANGVKDSPTLALAHVRLDALKETLTGKQDLWCGEARITPVLPDWLRQQIDALESRST
ncbi:MAG: folate-binding protein [Alphaproteobacteria bacterium]